MPSWSLSSLSNSARPDEDEEDDVPPEAELGLDEDGELVLLCEVDGELLDPLELFDESAA